MFQPETIELPDLAGLLRSRAAGRLEDPRGTQSLRRSLRTLIAGHEQVLQDWVESLGRNFQPTGRIETTELLSEKVISAVVSGGLTEIADDMDLVRLALNPLGLAQLHDAVRTAEDVHPEWIEAFADEHLADGWRLGATLRVSNSAMPEEPASEERRRMRIDRATVAPRYRKDFAVIAAGVVVLFCLTLLLVARHGIRPDKPDTQSQGPASQPSQRRPFDYTAAEGHGHMDWMETLESLKSQRRDPERMLSLLYGLSNDEVRASIDRQRRDNPTILAQDVLDELYRKWGKPGDFGPSTTSVSPKDLP